VKAWTIGDKAMPHFPREFEIVRKVVLQVTNIQSNNNKYYALELHQAKEKGCTFYRLYTHYGRTDDLEKNPESGQKENRFFDTLAEAQQAYDSIYREKTSPRKGYKEVALASTRIGSEKARGTATGSVDDKTLAKIKPDGGKVEAPKSQLPAPVQALVRYLYDEATTALTSAVSAKITAHGIETPPGHPHRRPDREGRGNPVEPVLRVPEEEKESPAARGAVRRVLHGHSPPHRAHPRGHRHGRHRLGGRLPAEAGIAAADEGHAPGQRRDGRRALQRPRRSGVRGTQLPRRAGGQE
jgi:predicted DNA-binding WGR domain protein